MIRINYNGTYKDVQPTDASYRLMEIGSGKMVSLMFSLTELIDFPIGSYIIVNNERYETFELFPYTMVNERQYDYTMSFYDDVRSFENYKFRNHVDGRLKFVLTAKPHEFVEHICRNLNAHNLGTTWIVGDCIDCSERTQSFNHNSIREALDSIAKLFDTEWEIRSVANAETTTYKINLRKTEYNKANALELAYGMGNGFKSGIGREMSEERAVDVLFVEGGERNIDQSKYTYEKEIEGLTQTLHANVLRLPKNADFLYFPPETEEITDPDNPDYGTLYNWSSSMPSELREKSFRFKTDADGFSIYRAENVANGYEESLDLTDIYPMREEIIEKVLTEDGREVYDAQGNIINTDEHHFYDLILAEDVVDYGDPTIWESGSEVTMIFQKGMLMGKEFKVSAYVKAEKRLKIQPQEIDGLKMPDPSSGYMPKIGEKIAVFHINLPNEYITAAERKMALQAAHYLWKHSEPEVKFNGVVDGIWAKKNWADIRNKIGLGYYVKFKDKNIAPNGKLMRIVGMKDYINKPHSPELTLSNTTVAQGVSSQLKKAAQNEVYTEQKISDVMQFAKRSFNDGKETLEMLDKAFKDKYTEGIDPSTVHTLAMLIGDESLQFEFGEVTGYYAPRAVRTFNVVEWEPTFDAATRTLQVRTDLVLRHKEFVSINGCNNIIGKLIDPNYPYWKMNLPQDNIVIPAEKDNVPFYLYAVVGKNYEIGFVVENGEYVLSETEMSDTDENFYFLIGTLNSANSNGERSFASVYGKTEISGGRITTDLIRSNDGTTYFDLKNNVIVGKINFKDGLISSRVWVGNDEQTAIAGLGGKIGGKDVVLWAGKDGDNYRFVLQEDGTMIFTDNNGQGLMGIYPNVGQIIANYISATTVQANKFIGQFSGSFYPEVPLANNAKALPNRMYVPVWIGKVYFNNNNYHSSYTYRARVQVYSGSQDNFDITVGMLGDGQCSIVFDFPFSNVDDYFVTMSGFAREDGAQCYATIQDKRVNGFFVIIADDSSRNNLDFSMQIWARTT